MRSMVICLILAVLVSTVSAQTAESAWKFDSMAGNRFYSGSWRAELGEGSSIQIGVMKIGQIRIHLMGPGATQIVTIETGSSVKQRWVIIDQRGFPHSSDSGPNWLGDKRYSDALKALPDEKLRRRILEALLIPPDAERFFHLCGLVLIV